MCCERDLRVCVRGFTVCSGRGLPTGTNYLAATISGTARGAVDIVLTSTYHNRSSGFSVDAASKGNFFNVSGTLGLNSLNLKNGAAPAVGLYSHGGAIYITSSGTVNMSYTNVTRCLSNPGMGGAISIYQLWKLRIQCRRDVWRRGHCQQWKTEHQHHKYLEHCLAV